jgi:hypothetical protein
MSAILETVDQSWYRVPAVLRRLDTHPFGKLEALSTALLHNSVAYVPGFQRFVVQQIGLNPDLDLLWRRGGHGEGDIVACTENDWTGLGSIETKGVKTNVSRGSLCPRKCGEWQSQFVHMTHRDEPLLVVAPRFNIVARELAWRAVEELPAHAVVMSYSAIADVIEDALRINGPPRHSLLDVLYDVEKVALPKN